MIDSTAWAADTFGALNLTWTALSRPRERPKWQRIQGMTADKAAGVELWVDPARGTLPRATVITPIAAAYTPLIVFVVAAVANTDRPTADAWLANVLKDLKTAHRKQVARRIGRVGGVARITTVGVFSLVLEYV